MPCRAPIAALLLLLSAACDQELMDVSIKVALVPGAGSCTGVLSTRSITAINAAVVRVTVFKPASASSKASIVCDQLALVGDGGTSLSLPQSSTDALSLLVEVYDRSTPMRLRAAGGMTGFNLKPRIKELKVLVSETGRFSCSPGSMKLSRSFHSATALPNGEVLVMGGLTAEPPGDPGGGDLLWVTNTVEVYDPRTGLFRQAKAGLSAGRAMHEAVLLTTSGQGPYDVLLVGGLTMPAGSTKAAATLSGAMPVFPEQGAGTASTVLLRYYPWTSPPQFQEMASSPQLKYRILPTAAMGGAGEVVLLGGVSGVSGTTLSTVNDFEVLTTAGSTAHAGAFPLNQARVGAAAAPLSATEILLFGGNVKSDSASLIPKVAELITLGASPRADPLVLESGSQALAVPVAHATLTPYGQGQLLLAGGLTVQTGKARTVKVQNPLLRLSRVGKLLRVSKLSATGFAPVAYQSATTLKSGDLFLCGGMPTTCAKDKPCGGTAAYTFMPKTEGLRKEVPMRHARMSHRASLLPDGTVLISGGLHHDGTRVVTHKTAELFAPAQIDPFNRGAGVVTKSCQ